MQRINFLTAVVFAIALTACANQQAPAEAALQAARNAFSAVSGETQKYLPDQARSMQDALASAQAALTKGDYQTAITQAQGVTAQVASLSTAISAKKMQLATMWAPLMGTVPRLVAGLKSRVEALGKSGQLPAGVTKKTLETARTGLAAATQGWSEAAAAAAGGDLATATAKAKDVRAKVIDLMKSLGMQVPGGPS
jgi:hypothetical protein